MNPRKLEASAGGWIFLVAFLLLSGIVGYSAFERVSLDGKLKQTAAGEYLWRVNIAPDRLGQGGPLLFAIRIRSEEKKDRTAEVFFNGTPAGSVSFGSRRRVEARLFVPENLLRSGENELRLAGEDRGWTMEGILLRNYVGYSRGLVYLVVFPRRSTAYDGLSWVGVLGLLGIWIVLRLAGRAGPEKPRARRLKVLCRVIVIALLGAAAVIPLFAPYKLLFPLRTLAFLALVMNVPETLGLGKRLILGIGKGVPRLGRFVQNLVESGPARRVAVLVVVPALVFLAFWLFMSAVRSQYGGDYSRFLRLEKGRLEAFEVLYLNPKVTPLFENADFETGTLENWMPEGDAFLYQPVRKENLYANLRKFFLNQQGDYWVGTYDKNAGASQGDRPSGRLVSTEFVVRAEKIRFLLGGGRTSHEPLVRQSAALVVDGRPVLEATGENNDYMTLREWDVRPWLKDSARIVLTDDPSPDLHFRHVNADWFHYYRESEVLKTISAFENYDGQFNFFMAFDPFLSAYRDDPQTYFRFIDEPAYRCGRIGFPLLVKLFSLNDPVAFPKTIVWLILVSHIAGAFFLLKIVIHIGKNPLWTFLYLLVPGFYYSLDFGLPESFCTAFLLAGLYAYLKGRLAWAVAALAAAMLFRETSFFLVVVLAADEAFRKRRLPRAMAVASSAIPYLLWRVFLTYRLFPVYGWKAIVFSPGDFSPPFLGFFELWTRIGRGEYDPAAVPTAFIYPALLVLIFAVAVYFLIQKRDVFSLSLFLYSLLSISLNYEKIWIGMSNGVRGTQEVFVFFILAFLCRAERAKPVVRYSLAVFWVEVFAFIFFRMQIGGWLGVAGFFR